MDKLLDHLVPVSCNRDCGGGCPLVAEIRDGRFHRIIDNPLRPEPDIRGCAKGYRALEVARSKDRLTTPLKRTGDRGSGQFAPVSWDTALDEIGARLMEFKNKFGSESLMVLPGSGSCRGKIHNTGNLVHRLFNLWGTTTTTSGYYSNTAAIYATASVFGTGRIGIDAEMLRGTELVILWGANICDLRFGVKLEPVLRDLKRQGVKFYVIDPRLTRTVKHFADGRTDTVTDEGSRWLAVRPGTDTALMAALLFQLLVKNKINRNFLKRYTSGFDDLEDWVNGTSDGTPKTPAWAADICGIPPAQVTKLADTFASAHPAAIIPGLSIQRVLGGEEAYRMSIALQAARGNIGIRGGSPGSCLWNAMIPPFFDTVGSGTSTRLDEYKNTSYHQPETIPINVWQDAVIDGKDGNFPTDIMGIYGVGNNLLLQSSDVGKSLKAYRNVELSVCHDLFMTETARYSDYVLPATHFLERDDVVSSGENYLYYSRKILDPPGEARDDYDILLGLADRLGIADEYGQGRSSSEWLNACLAGSDVKDPDLFLQSGIHDGGSHQRIGLSQFIDDPDTSPLPTRSGLIEFDCPANLEHGYPSHPHHRTIEASTFPLQMVTPHGRYRINSQNSNLPWFREREYPALFMHPEDADHRGLMEGSQVIITGEPGQLRLPLKITRETRPGVVWALQGNWEIDDAVNHLTSTVSTLPSWGSRTHSIRVEVEPANDGVRT